MGVSFGIDPEEGLVKAPFDGEVTMSFPTGHALDLKRADGLELLIHIGGDTIRLNGEGFKFQTSTGEKVKMGQPLVWFDPDLIRSCHLDPVVICAVTSRIRELEPVDFESHLQVGDINRKLMI